MVQLTTVAQVRKVALALPEVEEGTHFGMTAFSVAGKGFASLTKDESAVQLQLAESDVEAAVTAYSRAESISRGPTAIGARIPLADVSDAALPDLVRASYAHRAPKRLVRALESAAEDGAAGPPGGGNGHPARTRA